MTNKKRTKATKAAKARIQDKPDDGARPPVDPIPRVPSSTQGLSPPQLTAFIFLAISSSYVIEYARVAAEGIETKACSSYYIGDDACTAADVVVIQAKYYTVITSFILSTMTMVLCWNDQPLFQTLHTFLVASPIGTTYVALFAARGSLDDARIMKLCLAAVPLFLVAVSSIVTSTLAKPARDRFSSLQHMCLISIIMLNGKEVIGMLQGGVEESFLVDSADVSKGTTALLSFIALDKGIIIGLALFGLIFFHEKKKRSFLGCFAVVQLFEIYYQLPKIERDLRDSDDIRTTLHVSTLFCLLGAFAPNLKRIKFG